MPRDYEFRPELKGTLRKNYRAADPVREDMNVPAIQRAAKVQAVERKAAQVRENARSHFDKMKPAFVEREVAHQKRLHPFKPNHSLAHGPKPPGGITDRRQAYEMAMQRRAESIVNRRQQARLHAIDRSEARQVRRLMRTRTRTR